MRRTPQSWNSTLRRSPLPISSKPQFAVRVPLNKRSQKRKEEDKVYYPWGRERRRAAGRCQLRTPVCTGQPECIHHVIHLSQGGARIPGELADKQGQRFMASCTNCNQWVEDNQHEAREMGLLKSNPLRRPGLMETKE